MSKYYIEYGALQANGKRLIECETSALDAKKITEDFAREIADALNGREAWKQEKAEIEADALSVGGIVEAARHKPVGNAAAMREALVQCELFLGNVSRHGHPTLCLGDQCTACNGVDELRGLVVRALSAPARNCDINVNEGDTWDAYDGWAESYPNNGKTPRLLAPAEMVREAEKEVRREGDVGGQQVKGRDGARPARPMNGRAQLGHQS